jgi:hypothetical protein
MPAPGPAPVGPRTAAIVIRSVFVSPGLTASGCVSPVRRIELVMLPASVVTASRAATGRSEPLTSNWTPIDDGSVIGWSNVIWIHCPTGVRGLASAQYVLGLPSNALTGSTCGVSASQEPDEDAVTATAPDSTATVW